jgi:diaminopimelate epimerase
VKIPFVKMHGCANDYVVVDGAAVSVRDPAALARVSADRRTGVGADGLLLVLPPSDPSATERASARMRPIRADARVRPIRADARMRMFNPDGSEAEMCGNGLRCLGKFLFDRKRVGREFNVETLAGVCAMQVEATTPDGRASDLSVEIGVPEFARARVPVAGDGGPMVDEPFALAGRSLRVSALRLGNPHAIVFVDDVDHFPVHSVGPTIERDARFPERINVSFVEVVGADELKQRTWERGVGETLACGSGATAAAIVARRVRGFGPDVRLHVRGGDLTVHWDGDGKPARLRGPAVEVFEGVLDVA